MTTFRGPINREYCLSSVPGWGKLFYFDALPMWSHQSFTMYIRRQVLFHLPYDSAAGIGDDVPFLFRALQADAAIIGHSGESFRMAKG